LGGSPPPETIKPNFVVYDKGVKKVLPKVVIENRDYLPLIDFLQILDLPYSESVSSGFITISAGKNTIKLTKDRGVALVNQASVALSGAVVVSNQRWLVPPDFVSRVLTRAWPDKLTVSASGDRFLLGPGTFNRIEVKTLPAEHSSTIVVQMSAPVEAEIRKEDSRMTLNFGDTPVDPSRYDYQYKDEMVQSIHFEEFSGTDELVVVLANSASQVKVTRLATQNTYLLELTPPSAPSPSTPDRAGPPLPGAVIHESQGSRKWRLITIDPGHGGEDKGALIKENLFEKDVALSIAKKLRWALQTRLGVETTLTRDTDQGLSLEQRALAANAAGTDVFVSIHIGNRNRSPEFMSYVYVSKLWDVQNDPSKGQGTSDRQRIEFLTWEQAQAKSLGSSVRLAELVQTEINQKLNGGNTSSPFREAPLRLLSCLAMPAVLVEIGNASEPEWKEKISDSRFQDSLVGTLLTALEKFRSSYPRP
jgi:N-acetylmuramoyl-L-alanine amidase